MSIARVNTGYLTGAADAIRRKTGSQNPIPLTQFENEIDNIPTATLTTKTITQNGVYNASSDNADGYDVVTVDVPEKNTLDEYFANTLEIANIPSVTKIPDSFFKGKTNLADVIMPNVIDIGKNAFSDCTNLALTSLPNGITEISIGVFYNCIKLALTSLPNGVTNIGTNSFLACRGIPFLDFSNFTQIPTLGSGSFAGTTFPFYFRDQQQLDEWAAATNWSTYANRFQIKPSGVI